MGNNITQMLEKAHAAAQFLAANDIDTDAILVATAAALVDATDDILAANARDLSRMSADNPKYDRLKLSAARIVDIATDMRHVSTLPSPLHTIAERTLPNGLRLSKVAVPFGVVGVIYEARPNVTADVFGLCLKSGNVCVLKGGHDAEETNRAVIDVIHSVLRQFGVPEAVATLLPATRAATDVLLAARGLVDVLIPRGSAGLIEAVRSNAAIPVIETGAGVCHTFVNADADIAMASAIVNNAKTRRVSVCNALDCMLIHRALLPQLPQIVQPLAKAGVTVHADADALNALLGYYPDELLQAAVDKDFGTEYLSMQMAIRTVDSVDDAIGHIARYGSGHSEAIVTADNNAADRFCRSVDAACVYVNAPTAFTDGAQFGMGAEIGISTQKLHARGPMALPELTTYKWLIHGNGQTRP